MDRWDAGIRAGRSSSRKSVRLFMTCLSTNVGSATSGPAISSQGVGNSAGWVGPHQCGRPDRQFRSPLRAEFAPGSLRHRTGRGEIVCCGLSDFR
jgi:hypothetical protein